MANDPLALAGIGTEPPQEADYHAVYAAVTATERGRWFLTEFANRNRHADTGSLVAALTRIEAAVGGQARSSESAVTPDLAAAVEKIADIAFTLRERGGDPALCDALDAAAREIGVVSPKAAEGAGPPGRGNGDASGGDFEFDLQDREKFAAAAAALAASFDVLGEQTAGDRSVGDPNPEQETSNGSAPSASEGSSAGQQTSKVVIPPHDYVAVAEP